MVRCNRNFTMALNLFSVLKIGVLEGRMVKKRLL